MTLLIYHYDFLLVFHRNSRVYCTTTCLQINSLDDVDGKCPLAVQFEYGVEARAFVVINLRRWLCLCNATIVWSYSFDLQLLTYHTKCSS